MKITIDRVPHMTQRKVQEIAMALRITLIHHNIETRDVTVTFEEEL